MCGRPGGLAMGAAAGGRGEEGRGRASLGGRAEGLAHAIRPREYSSWSCQKVSEYEKEQRLWVGVKGQDLLPISLVPFSPSQKPRHRPQPKPVLYPSSSSTGPLDMAVPPEQRRRPSLDDLKGYVCSVCLSCLRQLLLTHDGPLDGRQDDQTSCLRLVLPPRLQRVPSIVDHGPRRAFVLRKAGGADGVFRRGRRHPCVQPAQRRPPHVHETRTALAPRRLRNS